MAQQERQNIAARTTRPAAVAGMFYPDDPNRLRQEVSHYLQAVHRDIQARAQTLKQPPRAIIAPHAGYRYSGPIAASAYTMLAPFRQGIDRVLLFGPSHRVAFSGLATVSVHAFDTPLGQVAVDRDTVDQLTNMPFVQVLDRAHAPEHGLEVHLPFIMQTLGDDVRIVPLLFGEASDADAATVIERFWLMQRTLIIISSDLSHFHDYDTATRMDRQTADAIARGDVAKVGPYQACGSVAVQGLMHVAQQHQTPAQLLDLRNSGDTAGPRDQVVGYGAWVYE